MTARDKEWLGGFVEVVDKLMRKKKISAKELALRVGISESSMYRYITGRRMPSARVAQDIMNCLK